MGLYRGAILLLVLGCASRQPAPESTRSRGPTLVQPCRESTPVSRTAGEEVLDISARPPLPWTETDPRYGAVIGVVTSKAGASIPGVTVVATSSSLQGTMAELTNDEGQYVLAHLPAGTYSITFYASESKIERPGVAVRTAMQTVLNQTIDTGAAQAGETITIETKVGSIDTGRYRGHQWCAELHTECGGNVPLPGRTFEGQLSVVGNRTPCN